MIGDRLYDLSGACRVKGIGGLGGVEANLDIGMIVKRNQFPPLVAIAFFELGKNFVFLRIQPVELTGAKFFNGKPLRNADLDEACDQFVVRHLV